LQREESRDFFRERGWSFEGGLRKRFTPGTTVDLKQELSDISNTAETFSPDEQGRARFTLSVMQPLLRGAGTKYNRSLIQIAKLDTESGYSEFIGELENHLLEVNRIYWSLYLARGSHLEKKRLVSETEAVVAEIESRSDLDSIVSQRSRARAALASRKADLVRSELEIKNAESRLRLLINDPVFVEETIGEVIPGDLPIATMAATDFDASIEEALKFRPEVHLASNQVRAADLREGMAKNEKRPELNLIGEIGTSTLRGEGDWSGAFADQYNGGEPTWGVGIVASVPIGRKAEKARHLRTQLEARQAKDKLRAVMDEVLLDVQIAHREVVTAWPDAKAKWEAAKAADEELSVLRDRRTVESADSGTSLYLENLLDAQQRRAFAREDFLLALTTYNAALTNLQRARGTLLQQENIDVKRGEDDDRLPLIQLVKDEAAQHAKKLYDSYK
jgi:outer membrane protein TolC